MAQPVMERLVMARLVMAKPVMARRVFGFSVVLSGASPRAQSKDLRVGTTMALASRPVSERSMGQHGVCAMCRAGRSGCTMAQVLRLRSRTRSAQDDRKEEHADVPTISAEEHAALPMTEQMNTRCAVSRRLRCNGPGVGCGARPRRGTRPRPPKTMPPSGFHAANENTPTGRGFVDSEAVHGDLSGTEILRQAADFRRGKPIPTPSSGSCCTSNRWAHAVQREVTMAQAMRRFRKQGRDVLISEHQS